MKRYLPLISVGILIATIISLYLLSKSGSLNGADGTNLLIGGLFLSVVTLQVSEKGRLKNTVSIFLYSLLGLGFLIISLSFFVF